MVAIISTIGAVMVAGMTVLGAQIHGAKKASESAEYAITNGHKPHIRTDIDRLLTQSTRLSASVQELTRDLGGVKADIRQIREEAADDRRDERERLHDIETTITKSKWAPPTESE